LLTRQKIHITGRVQGVGFRPAVYRLARTLDLTGLVYNDTQGVTIELQGPPERLRLFIERLQNPPGKPPLAKIERYHISTIPTVAAENAFVIKESDSQGHPSSQVTADIATCADCLAEMADEKDFRYHYPFINCTNCGPRYTIVRTIPYDRPNTTMSVFRMCEKCAAQYHDVTDRRFHAQPVACPRCGPRIWLTDNSNKPLETETDRVIARTAELLRAGKIVAIKGIGGFHLAVNALDDHAVRRLRQRKRRDHKPFAMMAASLETIAAHAVVPETARQILTSPECPIVLLEKKADSPIAASVAPGVNTFGFMLCYAPLHHLLFAHDLTVLVMTSGNISEEPLIRDNHEALERLGSVADAFLMHNREIFRQVDDSIVHFIADTPVLLRRARGYVPTPVFLDREAPCDIFAAGADLKNTFAFVKQDQLICSEHVGDLADAEVYHHYIASVEHLRKLFEVQPAVVACDLHPAYFSTRYALSLPHCKHIRLQHHWAHVASVLAEHQHFEPVIGLVCDGTGYGSDGAIWGCECLHAWLTGFERIGHLAYYDLPGADAASKEPIRVVISLLWRVCGTDLVLSKYQWLLEAIEPELRKQQTILAQIRTGVNTVRTSSLGRLFDAVTALIGLGNYNHFDAQLPMALESAVAPGVDERYDFRLIRADAQPVQLELWRMILQIVSDLKAAVPPATIAAKFHNTIADALVAMAVSAREKTALSTVALSGGVFCNRYLAERVVKLLNKSGFRVLYNQNFPSNDGGISVGQAAIAAALARQEHRNERLPTKI